MRDRCANYWEGIVTLAEGGRDEAARHHVESCSECARKLEQLRIVMSVGDLKFYDAPASLIASAKGLMPAPERRPMSLLRSTTAWSGARAVAEDFQLVVGEADTQVRLMYSRAGNGWEVMGKAPSSGWSVEAGRHLVSIGVEGRFSFHADKLADTGFTLSGAEGEFYIPSAEELLSGGHDDRH